MSHIATNWAWQQRQLKAGAKLVLLQLADRHNPDRGCFPSQERLAADCEMARSAVRRNLDTLAARGLIARKSEKDAVTGRQTVTRYMLAFEEGFEREPGPESGHGEPGPEKAKSRGLKQAKVRGLNQASNPVKEETVKEPLSAQARAKAEPQREREDSESGFDEAFSAWPTAVADDRGKALAAWRELTPDERSTAAAESVRFVERYQATGRTKLISFGRYLSGKGWTRLPANRPSAKRQGGQSRPRETGFDIEERFPVRSEPLGSERASL